MSNSPCSNTLVEIVILLSWNLPESSLREDYSNDFTELTWYKW